ncbi:MAG TPA: acyltransferase [Methylotenera sp.]|nr:acyltransferase [Methylotenera sp.]
MEYKSNNFGFLRLLLATLVIISHSPELLYPNHQREILSSIFDTITFGELAVDSFFLISGYLILQSFKNSTTLKSYFFKRCLRIYPAFVVVTLVCIFIVAPLSGGIDVLARISALEWLNHIGRVVTLKQPLIDGVFVNNRTHYLNGSMWTIRYEFFCYLLIPFIFYLRFFNIKLISTLLLLLASLIIALIDFRISSFNLQVVRFCALFFSGCFFYMFRDKIKWNLALTIVSIIGLIFSLSYSIYVAHFGLMIFGAYLMFNFALNFKSSFISSIGTKNDISYGVYLYAWPVQNLIIQYYPSVEPYQVNIGTLLVVLPLAYLSYRFVERPFINMKSRFVFAK